MACRLDSIPSSSVSNWFTTRSVAWVEVGWLSLDHTRGSLGYVYQSRIMLICMLMFMALVFQHIYFLVQRIRFVVHDLSFIKLIERNYLLLLNPKETNFIRLYFVV